MARGRKFDDEGAEFEIPTPASPAVVAAQNDITLTCKDCGDSFQFTVGEQQFFREKIGPDYVNPVRCKQCRILRKLQKKAPSQQ